MAGARHQGSDGDHADDPGPPAHAPRARRRPTQRRRNEFEDEAGYFIGVKGKHNILIIRESGPKMPADLGDIYASLADKTNIAPIERTLSVFMGAL